MNTVIMPVSRNAHQTQLPATPLRRTISVTRFGVSVLNVVATIETPISHHGAARPDVKNSAVLVPARRASSSAGTNDTAIETATIVQSREVRRTGWEYLTAYERRSIRGAKSCEDSGFYGAGRDVARDGDHGGDGHVQRAARGRPRSVPLQRR